MFVGQKVKVVNNGYRYSTYDEWIEINTPLFLKAFRECRRPLQNGDIGLIIAKKPHLDKNISDNDLYLIVIDANVYLIDEEGLELL